MDTVTMSRRALLMHGSVAFAGFAFPWVARGQPPSYKGQKRDPLTPLFPPPPDGDLTGEARDPNRPRGSLEHFDVLALKLVGIVRGDLGRKALIKAPNGKSYVATLDTYMGQYNGKVIAIETDRLVLEERYVNKEGERVLKTLTMPLQRKGG